MGRTTGGPAGGKAAAANDGLGASLLSVSAPEGTSASSASERTAALVVGGECSCDFPVDVALAALPDAEFTGVDARARGTADEFSLCAADCAGVCVES